VSGDDSSKFDRLTNFLRLTPPPGPYRNCQCCPRCALVTPNQYLEGTCKKAPIQTQNGRRTGRGYGPQRLRHHSGARLWVSDGQAVHSTQGYQPRLTPHPTAHSILTCMSHPAGTLKTKPKALLSWVGPLGVGSRNPYLFSSPAGIMISLTVAFKDHSPSP
jgi:hypothetical protein